MKKYILAYLLLLYGVDAFAKNGLEEVIVEKYYVADQKDEELSAGKLRAGSVTYRIFANMLPGYRFQAAYGVPGHPLFLKTSTYFFNTNTETATANEIQSKDLNKGALMLDSWLSVAASADKYMAVLKSSDTTKAILNTTGFLENKSHDAGIPISVRDGMFPASPVPVVNYFGIDSTLLDVFKSENSISNGQQFFTENGSWACFGGSAGTDSSNCVLIAQITTNGKFSFELNIQIGTPTGNVENYVARNPKQEEIKLDSLVFHSDK